MARALLPLLLLTFACTCGRAQRLGVEELRQKIAEGGPDSALQVWYTGIAGQQKDDATAWRTLDTVRQLGERINTAYARGLYWEQSGRRHARQRNYEEAEVAFNNAIDVYAPGNRWFEVSRTYTRLGIIDRDRGKTVSSMEYMLKALEFAERSGDNMRMANSLTSLGKAQQNIGNLEAAEEYFRRSFHTAPKDEPYTRINPLLQIAEIHQTKGRFDSAVYYNQIALRLSEDLGAVRQRVEAVIRNNLSTNYLSQEDYPRATVEAEKSYFMLAEMNRDHEVMTIANTLGQLYNRRGRPNEARTVMTAALQRSRDDDFAELRLALHHTLGDTWHTLGNIDSVAHHYQLAAKLRDQLSEKNAIEAIAELETKYQTEQKEAEITRLALEDKLNQAQISRQTWVISGALVALGLLGSFLYFLWQQRQRIQAQNDTISVALVEKDTLLKEIHHRVKNNLQMVSSLLSLQSDYIEDDIALDALRMGQSRVRSMAIIHQKLYMRDEVSTAVSARDYLDQLIGELMQTLNVNGASLKLTKQLEDIDLDIDRLIPLGLIANEVITNAMKYAFVNRDSGQLDIDFRRNGPDVELIIADDGPGLGQELSEKTDSFGGLLIRTFAEQLEGEVAVDGGAGTRVRLWFPFG